MQIVIDIDDNIYTRLFDNGDINAVDMLKACIAIRKGTPLPKGHDRLIDARELDNDLKERQKSYEHTSGIRQPINEAIRDGIIIARTHINYADTIIKADKEQDE